MEITPVNIYTKEVIKGFTEAKELEDSYSRLNETALDGAFAGAHVKAHKLTGGAAMDFTIEEMRSSDWLQVSAIYLEGIRTGIATFEGDIPSWDNWNHDLSICYV